MENITEFAVGKVSSSQCWEALQQKPNSYLIDVRAPEEWEETGMADLSSIKKNANLLTWIFFTPNIHPNKKFIAELEQVFPNKDVELFFICKSGGRSMQAANAALSDGYKNSYSVDDGFVGSMFDNNFIPLNGWIKNNLPRRKA